MTEYRLAHGLEKLRTQVNLGWPNRSKDSDGWIGDASHQSRSSDHNPWIYDATDGVNIVSAIDITHDPSHGFDSYGFADMLMEKKDNRIKYVISNRRIGAGNVGPHAWQWRPYSGQNPHDHHVHISILSDKPHYDATTDWDLSGAQTVPDPNFIAPPRTLRNGSVGADVAALQRVLNVTVDSVFGNVTERAVKAYQASHGLHVDGVAGPQTMRSLDPTPF